MRPTTPQLNFARQAGPTSPPQTPTTTMKFPLKEGGKRNGMVFTKSTIPESKGTIIPNGNGPSFFYTPSNKAADLSPRSSSSDTESSVSSAESAASTNPARSLSSSPIPVAESPPILRMRIVSQEEANFTLEEFGDSDYEEWDSDDEEAIRPHQYEDAESEKAPSVKAAAHPDLEQRKMTDKFKEMLSLTSDDEREAWLEMKRAEKRRKRRSSGSVQKRTWSISVGSASDDEDLQPITFEGANEAGSSARRLRRRLASRCSLIFDDPPARIDEEDEGPESVEELVDIQDGEEEGDAFKELPYYRYVQDMEVDTSDDDEF